ncbi:MAG: DUF3137 domain-containing protein [Tenericutes bacterium]|nr:DUF3137 domain-containing protein [Mycoplasmatota bacterium]
MFQKLNEDKARYERRMLLGLGVTVIAFISYIPLGIAVGMIAFFIISLPFLGGAIYAGINLKKIKDISNEFKKVYVTDELKKVFPASTYIYNHGFTEEEVIKTGLLRKQDRYASEDMISGNFVGVNFRCSDVLQKEVSNNGKSSSVTTVFRGRFYEFDFPKSFKSNLLLLQPYNFRPFSNFEKIKMESIKFNSEMKVYAKNEHEAFYLLTPQFMERLLYMDNKYNDKISFSFLDNKLSIAIDSRKDYFDIKPFKTVNKSIISEYRDELNDIKEFIRVLQLDQTLFK